MAGTWYAQEAIAFMKENEGRPFFVQIGFHEPHSPFWFPVDSSDRFKPEDMPVPKPGPEDAWQIPKVFADLTDADKRGIIASSYTSTAFLDVNVGRVLEAIDLLGLTDNTLVIYVGDNGYHLGQHGRFEKHCMFERAVRVPLIMRLPGRMLPGSNSEALVELVDIVPTVLDYLGLPTDRTAAPPRDLHGHTLRPVIEGHRYKVRDTVFSEYRHTEEAMVRTERYKLIYRTSRALTDWYEPVQPPKGRGIRLYDTLTDPEEMHDIAGEPLQRELVSDLLDQLADFYRHYPPRGETPPENLTRDDFLDWAIRQRNPTTSAAR
jgi:choline-sulfatase